MLIFLISVARAGDDFEDSRFFYGDIHSHTGASGDGGSADLGSCINFTTGAPASCGNVADIGTTARANGLDFLSTVDHVTSAQATTTEADFLQVFHLVDSLNDPAGEFITLPGAEDFVELPDGSDVGHRSLLFFGDSAALSSLARVDAEPSGSISNDVADCSALTTFMDGLTARFGPALLLPHHPGVKKPMATDWACFDPTYEPLVEVYSEHGSSMSAGSTFDIPWSGYQPSGTVQTALDPAGFSLRFGFGAGSDNHDTHPGQTCGIDTVQDQPYGSGITVVFQPSTDSFDRTAIYDAFMERRTYASTGPHVPLVVEARLADGTVLGGMGEAVEFATGQDLVVEARMPASTFPDVVEVVAVGPAGSWPLVAGVKGTWTATIPALEVPEHLFVDVELDASVLWPDGCEDGGADTFDHLWSSPIWFDPTGTDADGDGWTVEQGDCDDKNDKVNPGAMEACGRDVADQDCDGIPASEDPDCFEDTGDTGTDTGTDTAETGGDTAEDSAPPVVIPDDTGSGLTGPLATHRCACDAGGAGGLGLAAAGAALLVTLRRRRP